MSMLDIRIGSDQVRKAELFLDSMGDAARTGVVRSLNRAIYGVRTDGVAQVREQYNISASDARRSFYIRKANFTSLEATARSSGRRVNLMAFGARPKLPTRRRVPPVGVSAEVIRGRRKVYPGTFVGRGQRSGKVMVFRREGRERLPVESVTRLAVPQMLGSVRINEAVQAGAVVRFEKNLDHEIDFLLRRMGAR